MQISSLSNGFWGDQEAFNLTAHLKRNTGHAPHKQTPMQAIAAQMAAEEAKKNEPAPSIAGVSGLMSRNFTAAAAEAPTPLSVHWEQPETSGAPQTELPSLLDALEVDGSGEQSPLEEMREQLEQAAEEALRSPAGEKVFFSAPAGMAATAAHAAEATPSQPTRAALPASAYAAAARATAPQAAEGKDAVAATV